MDFFFTCPAQPFWCSFLWVFSISSGSLEFLRVLQVQLRLISLPGMASRFCPCVGPGPAYWVPMINLATRHWLFGPDDLLTSFLGPFCRQGHVDSLIILVQLSLDAEGCDGCLRISLGSGSGQTGARLRASVTIFVQKSFLSKTTSLARILCMQAFA